MRKLIILSLLFISTLLIGQSGAIFETTFNVGSFRDAASNTLGTDTDVSFGKDRRVYAIWNGNSSKINYDLDLSGVYSVRVKCNPTSFATTMYLFDCRGTNNDGSGNVRFNITTGAISAYGLVYINGVPTTNTIVGVNNEIVITGITLIQGTGLNLSLIGSSRGNANEFLGTIDLFEIYTGTLTSTEVLGLYNEGFKYQPSLNQELTLVSQPQNKDLSYIPNLVASYTFANPINGELIDEAGNSNNGTVVGGISTREGMSFSDAYVDYGAIGNVKTITFRIDLESTTEKIFEGASNDLEVYANAGTLTYPDYDNAYIDGIDTDVITTGWHTITVTSSTNVNLTAAKIGIINTTYGDFEIAENQFYSDEKGTTWIDAYHAKWEKVVKLIDFEFAPVGLPAMGWQQGTGSYEVSESVTGLEHRKYLECTASGTTSFYVNDLTDSTYVESLDYYNSGWTDVGGYTIYRVANDNAWFSYSGNKVTLTLTTGQRIDNIIIQNQK